jgi:hypothetical protein
VLKGVPYTIAAGVLQLIVGVTGYSLLAVAIQVPDPLPSLKVQSPLALRAPGDEIIAVPVIEKDID